ncbi:unnamed protein product [Amoebophrya sp. A25]|nr:unnamed protein product [Amoebophrya sp. A25]|eukprot:GSA25T00017909001.1
MQNDGIELEEIAGGPRAFPGFELNNASNQKKRGAGKRKTSGGPEVEHVFSGTSKGSNSSTSSSKKPCTDLARESLFGSTNTTLYRVTKDKEYADVIANASASAILVDGVVNSSGNRPSGSSRSNISFSSSRGTFSGGASSGSSAASSSSSIPNQIIGWNPFAIMTPASEAGDLPSGAMGGGYNHEEGNANGGAPVPVMFGNIADAMRAKWREMNTLAGVDPAAGGNGFSGMIVPTGSADGSRGAMLILRPWLGEFCSNFKRPTRFDGQQIAKNLSYFRANYLVVTLAVLVFGLLMNPTSLICILVVGVCWFFFLAKNQNPEWRTAIGGLELTPYHRLLLMGGVSSLFLVVTIGGLIFMLVGLGALASVGHAVAHAPLTDYSRVIENEELGV